MPAQQCGAALAFLGFGISLIIGLWVNNPFVTVILRGLWVMLLFYILGSLLSVIGQKVVQENFNREVEGLQQIRKKNSPDEENQDHVESESTGDVTLEKSTMT